MIQIIYADAHPLMRQNVRDLLSKTDDIELAAEVDNGRDAVQLTRKLAPDVLVTDLMMSSLSGIRLLQALRSLKLSPPVIVLSMDTNEALVRQALLYGARGYLSKRNLTSELLPAIRAVHRGELYLDPVITQTQIATPSETTSKCLEGTFPSSTEIKR